MSFATAPVTAPRWGDFYVSAAARAVSNCGDMMAATALALILAGRGAGAISVAALLMAAAIPPVALGPVVAGVLVAQYGARLPLLIDAATYLAIPLAGLLIRTRRGGSRRPASTAPGGRQEVFRMRSDALIWPMMVLIAAVVLAISAVN